MAATTSSNSTGVRSGEMYKVKPFYDDKIKLEDSYVMYRVRNLHKNAMDTGADDSDPVSSLEKKQESILNRLSDIKSMLDKLTDRYSPEPQTASASCSAKTSKLSNTALKSAANSTSKGLLPASATSASLGSCIHDIVISADPDTLPLSLFALYEALKVQLPTLATSYVHSSVKNVDPRLCDVIKAGSQVNRGSHAVALSLVWKKVENGPLLMVSPSKQCVVQGEVNIARYLNRIINPEFDTMDAVAATQIDEWLDIASQQLLNGNTKEKAAAMRNLNSRLGRNDWLVGSSFSLADIVTWSAVHQSKQVDSASANVKKWLKACAESPLLQSAISLL